MVKLRAEGSLLRIFIGESCKYEHKPLYEWIVLKAREYGLAGATVLRGMMGFGANSRIKTTHIWPPLITPFAKVWPPTKRPIYSSTVAANKPDYNFQPATRRLGGSLPRRRCRHLFVHYQVPLPRHMIRYSWASVQVDS